MLTFRFLSHTKCNPKHNRKPNPNQGWRPLGTPRLNELKAAV